jgi:hypothetical protein
LLENFLVGKKRIKTQASTEDLLACIPYLHGHVVDEQFRAACQYEYARESNILRRAAELFRGDPSALAGEIFLKIDCEFPAVGNWLISTEWRFVWQCPSFPAQGWNQLSDAERADLLLSLPPTTNRLRPLQLGEVMSLTPYLDQLKEMAEKARAELKESVATRTPRQKVYPILELKNTPFVQALLPLDFRKTRKRLLQEIDLWLQLPENKDRFDKHQPKTEAGTEKEAKDRLKDLAAWRLYRELGYGEALEFARRNRLCGSDGVPRKFHDWRQDQTKRVLPNAAPLYSEESGFLKAKARALKYRAILIPWEFGELAENANRFVQEMVERFKKALNQTQKISKSSA